MRPVILVALAAGLVLGLGAAPTPAGAGACKKLGFGKQCVERVDLEKNAIDSGRVKDKSLTGADIKDASLTGADIKDASLTGADVGDGTLTGADVEDESLTGADIQDGGLSGTNFQAGSIGNADLAAGAVTADEILARILVVSPVGDGSDATANGMELLDAITFLGSVNPLPGAANPWTIKLEPGIYDIGTTSVSLPSFVNLEGSGQGITEVTGNVEGDGTGNPAVVNMTDNTIIRDITVTNRGGVNRSYAILLQGGPIRISNSTVQALDGANRSWGFLGGAPCSDLTLADVSAKGEAASGSRIGVFVQCTAVAATNLIAKGTTYGFNQNSGSSSVRNSVLTGTNNGSALLTGGSMDIAHSQLNGAVVKTTGAFACIGNYNNVLAAVVCPP